MSLLGGDLTTQQRVANWLASPPTLPSPVIGQMIGSMSGLIYSKLNRTRLFSRTITRTFNGVGNNAIVLPDYPVTRLRSVTIGRNVIDAAPANELGPKYGYRFVPWDGELPGENATLEFNDGAFWSGLQNVTVAYDAGYLIASEAATVPSTPFKITVLQEQGVWSRDNGVVYASTGATLLPVTAITGPGQYIPPPDATPGVYTFGTADAGQNLLLSYSIIPAVLEEACIQMIAERMGYRTRVGEVSKSLGGQETIRFMRGNNSRAWGAGSSLPPEVMDMIWPYVNVVYPAIGSSV